MPIQIQLDQIPQTREMQILVIVFFSAVIVSFIYKYIIKDIIDHLRNRKNKKEVKEESGVCLEEQIVNHQIFNYIYKCIKYELTNNFSLDKKKDLQFYLLGKCVFITFYNSFRELAKNSVNGYMLIKNEKIEKITFNMLIDFHENMIKQYSDLFFKNGGKEEVLNKYLEYNKQRNANIEELFTYIVNQDFFNKSIKNTTLALFNLYFLYVIQSFEDLKADYKKINGDLDVALDSFEITNEFKNNAKALTVYN